MKVGQPFQSSLPTEFIQSGESSEGGLDLGQFLASLRRKALLILSVAAAVTAAAGIKSFTDTPTYSGEFEVLVQPMSAETAVISSVPGALTNEENSSSSASRVVVNADLIKILTSSRVLLPVIEQLQKQYPDLTYSTIVRNLAVAPLAKDSNILQIAYSSPDPQQVHLVLDKISKAYLDYSLQSRQADIRRGLQFVEDKLPDLQERVTNLQQRLQELRQQNDLIDPESRGAQLSNQVNTFTQQQLDAQIQLEQIRKVYADLRSQLGGRPNEAAASSALSQNPRYQSLLAQLLEVDSQIAEASTLYLETSPDMQLLREQRQNVLSLLAREGQQTQREVIDQMRSLEAREQALRGTLGSLNANVNQLSEVSREYTNIQRELQITTENLNQFLMKREALQIDVAQREVPWELLTPPTQPIPGTTSLPNNLILGAILGLLLGTGVALLLDKVTDVIYTAEELKRITRLPVLGAIPVNDELGHLIPRTSPTVELQEVGVAGSSARPTNEEHNRNGSARPYKIIPLFEAFRSLYANVRLLNVDAPIRTLVISSVLPGEGKSTVAAFLAQAAAALGQRVLLVDTDLRQPHLHEYLNLENTKGLTDIISGSISLQEAVQRSPLEPNLFMLTAGAIPPDPTRALSSRKMKQLMEQVQSSYDLVIYDMPPLLGFADVYLMATQTNGIILVSELGKLRRSLVGQVFEQIKVANTPILGIVLQKVMT
jgi:capsular exopolysaccharide synthesis family protein